MFLIHFQFQLLLIFGIIQVGVLVGIAGVSGSGKSSLVSGTLIPRLKSFSKNKQHNGIAYGLEGLEHISGYAEVTQDPIGRNINSIPATYIGIWKKIRKLFSKQAEAMKKELSMGNFSFNSNGACSECGGSGSEKIWLGGNYFINNTCEDCHGKRYNDVALSISYKDKTIYDILEMTVSEAADFFKDKHTINTKLKIMERIGLGYIKLGQPTPTLSGGEAQRIKLVKELSKRRKNNILYVLDEPTTGLSLL